jgi:hypothetical protein
MDREEGESRFVKTIYLDIETCPQSSEALEALMPPEVAKPEMPSDLANPVEPDWKAKCPKYGGDSEKRQIWIDEAVKKWVVSTMQGRERWQQGTLEARARFVESAALRAESGHVKMIGLSVNLERTIYLWEPDRKLVDMAAKEATESKVALFSPFMLEKQMFQRFAKDFVAMMSEGELVTGKTSTIVISSDAARVVTYYGNTFDLPFLARRAAICGEPALMRFLRMHRRGRYLDASRFVDLHEEWTARDRETKTGGLEGLAKILGVEITKSGDGATFYHWYRQDPGEGIRYLLNDLSMTEACAVRMGI